VPTSSGSSDEKYFLLHAPRQTGKNTCLLALMDYLNKEGKFRALYANIEGAQAAGENVDQGDIHGGAGHCLVGQIVRTHEGRYLGKIQRHIRMAENRCIHSDLDDSRRHDRQRPIGYRRQLRHRHLVS
jgi:hypothetical protein